jgi:hypothetical protein
MVSSIRQRQGDEAALQAAELLAQRRASVPLVHEVAVLAIAKQGAHLAPRKWEPLGSLTPCLLDGILQSPARLFVIQHIRPGFQHDLAENPEHGVKVLDSMSSLHAMKLFGPPQSSGGLSPSPPVQTGCLPRLRLQPVLDAQLMAPGYSGRSHKS